MPVRTQNVSQLELTNHLSCQREQKMHVDVWKNPSHFREATKHITSWIDQTNPMPACNKYVSQIEFTKHLTSQRGTRWISSCADLTAPMPKRSEVATQLVLIKSLLNLRCIRFVDKTYSFPAMTQNLSKHVLIKQLPCQRWHKMSCVVATIIMVEMVEKTERVSKLVLTEPNFRKCISIIDDQTYLSHAIEDTRCI